MTSQEARLPLYVNHPRTEPVPGDVARTAYNEAGETIWIYSPNGTQAPWLGQDHHGAWRTNLETMPGRLRLLVDGETGQVVTAGEQRGARSVSLIAAERQRQIDVEGWTPDHDAAHNAGDLARAAACYALPATWRSANIWPWDLRWWKPSHEDRLRELVKAGALIAAEIDRLLMTGRPGE